MTRKYFAAAQSSVHARLRSPTSANFYLYVPLAFLVTGLSNLSLRKVDRARRKQLGLLTGGAFVLIVVAVGVIVIGLSAFASCSAFTGASL